MHRRNLLFFQHRDSFEESIFSLCKVFFFAGLPRLKARFFMANPERSARKTEYLSLNFERHSLKSERFAT